MQTHHRGNLTRVGWHAVQQAVVQIYAGRHPRAPAMEQPFRIGRDQPGHDLVDRRALFGLGDGQRTGGWWPRVSRRRCLQQVRALQAGRGPRVAV